MATDASTADEAGTVLGRERFDALWNLLRQSAARPSAIGPPDDFISISLFVPYEGFAAGNYFRAKD